VTRHSYVGVTAGIFVLAVQNTRLIPPLSITPSIVNVIVSPRQTVSGDTVIVAFDASRVPLSRHPSHASLQHCPFPQQNCGSQHAVPPQHICPLGQHVPWQHAV
jgi:hypothetical protein